MTKLTDQRPPGWEQPKLTTYLESMWSNTIATFANKQESHRLGRIDDLMFTVGVDWKPESSTVASIVPVMMYYRAHSSFRAACALGMGCSLVEAMGVLRMALEGAGYAALLRQKPELAQVWWDRDCDDASLAAARKAFSHGAVRDAIMSFAPDLPKIYDELYNRTIRFGAHPNQMGITSGLRIKSDADEFELIHLYLHGDGPILDHWIRTANQIGICILKIYSTLYPARFESLQAGPHMERLASGL